ncbi:MAG: hypothetical protein JL50_00795 [Peptococcaceae bacterium BICA1-7]|nr:MAG: hypothetical protein JL50_00795 [Peptococcaceae bacterium BICA1-7]HBV98074.1 hypothetical protein [Desulfotomaculum sp.]
MKKHLLLLILMAFLIMFTCIPALAATSDEVRTFGSTDERNRDNSVEGRVLYLMYIHEAGGASFSQPLILDAGRHWEGEFDMAGQQLVITVENNRLNGYVMCGLLSGELLDQNMKTIDPDWSIPLSGTAPTKSHPTFYETPDGKKYIFIGAYGPYLDIVDITDIKKARLYKSKDLLHTTDVTSAPLVMEWEGHQVVVATSGNTAKVVLLVDPLKEGGESGTAYIDTGSGRTSSSPAPLDLDGDGKYESFAVGLDQGTSRGELRIYNLNNILGIDKNGQVEQISQDAETAIPLSGGLVGSFAVEKNVLYFGDCRSQVYGYDVVRNKHVLYNGDLKGTFSNRSPALTSSRVYFPAVGRKGEQGSLIAINRSTGKTEWIKQFQTNAQTAPVVIRSSDGGAGILEGTSRYGNESAYLAMLDPADGTTACAQEIAFTSPTGGTQYASGVSGELAANRDTMVAATDVGIYIWRLLHTLDLSVEDLDTGVTGKAEPGKTYHGKFKIKFNGKIKTDTPLKLSAAGIGVLVNGAPVQNLAMNGQPLPAIDYRGTKFPVLTGVEDGKEYLVEFDYTAAGGRTVLTAFTNLALGNVKVMWDENTYDNNKMEKTVEELGYDIKIKLQSGEATYTSIDGDPTPVQLTATVTRKDDIPGVIDVTGAIKDGFPIDLKLGPGESGKVEYSYPARPGTYNIDAEAWPEGSEDIYPPDNRDRITVTVENEVFDLDTEIRSGVLR